MQELEIARGAVCENDHATLAKLLVSCKDGVVEDYIKFHKNELHVVCNSGMWLQFEKEILELENLEVEMSEFHIAFAKQCIHYIADACDNDELAWRLWLCLWVVGFIDRVHVTHCLAFIMEKMGVPCEMYQPDLRSCWIVSSELRRRSVDINLPIPISVVEVNRKPRVFAPCTSVTWLTVQPLSYECETTTVKIVAKALQQCFVRPPDRVMQLLDLPRFQTPIGTEV